MAFTPEDGTGLEDTNSYITEQVFRDYFADRGKDVSILSQAQVEVACVRATDYIDKRFGKRFRGFKQTSSQSLEWPRLDAIDESGYLIQDIPKNLKHATAEYALRAHALIELAPDPALLVPTRDTGSGASAESAGQAKRKREKVGPIEEEIEQVDASSYGNRTATGSSQVDALFLPAYPAADLLLEELLTSNLSRDLTRA
jgi:hypothetical protein